MRIIYEAEDGTRFDNEEECLSYELAIDSTDLDNIIFYDEYDLGYHINKKNIYDDNIYNNCESIYIHNEAELNALLKLAKDCGWCEFETFTEPGYWVREGDVFYANWRKEHD